MEWIPNNLLTSVCSVPPTYAKTAATFVGNSTSIQTLFRRVSHQVCLSPRRRRSSLLSLLSLSLLSHLVLPRRHRSSLVSICSLLFSFPLFPSLPSLPFSSILSLSVPLRFLIPFSLFPLLHSSLHSSLNLFLYWSHISSLILRLSVFGHV